MKNKREKPKPVTDRDEGRRQDLEAIVTCSCSHGLNDHSPKGCSVETCDCEIEVGMLVLGKIAAIDDL